MKRSLLYWLLWAGILAVLAYLGYAKIHVREFIVFITVLLGLAVVAVALILTTYRKGDRITREPFDT
ncbi:MAG: hypothetical protein OXC11_11420 [Rhodospirillales bacterium]|nr:hypothetical protein [Rhodospirillales bacterium]